MHIPAWMTWFGHAFVGLGCAFLFGVPGWTLAVGFYGGKEYKESDSLTDISRDNVMDFVGPIIGGGFGVWLRGAI